MDKIRLLLVDDHEIFLDGLVSLLSNQDEIEIIGKALNGVSALEKITEVQPDILLTDLSMPEMDGIQLVKYVKKDFPEVRILVLSMHRDREMVNEIVMAEAEGYILKKHGPKRIDEGNPSNWEWGYLLQ